MLAEGYARLEQADEALSCLTEAAQNIEVTNERYHEAELHPLLLTAHSTRAAEGAQIQVRDRFCPDLAINPLRSKLTLSEPAGRA